MLRMSKLEVTFWGVRGSVPAPGPKTAVYGGNTSCVEVRAGGELIILDLGSGLRPLGETLVGKPVHGSMLLSHYHWDHIQGLPFFGPAYNPASSFDIYGATRGGLDVRAMLSAQMVPPYFPVPIGAFAARLDFRPIAGGEKARIGPVTVTACELNHPNGSLGYRLDFEGRSVVYGTDNEHGPEADERLVAFAHGADVLIYDAMYTPEEYRGESGPPKIGWGHSTWEAGVRTAQRAGVGTLVLFHHDPGRADEGLETILGLARKHHPNTRIAREGETLTV